MSDKFDKFTERSRNLLTRAQRQANRLDHHHIDDLHLLLALIGDVKSIAFLILEELGVNFLKLRANVETTLRRGETPVPNEIGLTPRAKRIIELAVEEAQLANDEYIGTEYILAAFLREGESRAAQMLDSFGVELDIVRKMTPEVARKYYGQNRSESPFTDEDYLKLDALLLKIPREQIVLFTTGRVSLVGFLQAYSRLFGLNLVNRLSTDKWAVEHLKGHCQELTQAYWDRLNIGPCPTNDQLLIWSVRGVDVGPHVSHCGVCGPLFQYMQPKKPRRTRKKNNPSTTEESN